MTILPGDLLSVTVTRQGSQPNQGIGHAIAYSNDGIMVLVEGAGRLVGETVTVTVTRVLQTAQGSAVCASRKAET